MIGYYFYEYKVGMAQQIRVRSGSGEGWQCHWYVLCVHVILYLHRIVLAQPSFQRQPWLMAMPQGRDGVWAHQHSTPWSSVSATAAAGRATMPIQLAYSSEGRQGLVITGQLFATHPA